MQNRFCFFQPILGCKRRNLAGVEVAMIALTSLAVGTSPNGLAGSQAKPPMLTTHQPRKETIVSQGINRSGSSRSGKAIINKICNNPRRYPGSDGQRCQKALQLRRSKGTCKMVKLIFTVSFIEIPAMFLASPQTHLRNSYYPRSVLGPQHNQILPSITSPTISLPHPLQFPTRIAQQFGEHLNGSWTTEQLGISCIASIKAIDLGVSMCSGLNF